VNPLVSCIMPVRGRRELAMKAIDCFNAQTYEHRNLLILQDSDAPTFNASDALPPNVKVTTASDRFQIGQKRNMLCRDADGELICHWDSDDWSAATRIERQVELIQRSGLAVHAFHWLHFVRKQPLQVFYYKDAAQFTMGTSLMFWRDFWVKYPFAEYLPTNSGEDGRFCKQARALNQISSNPTDGLMVARIHDNNTSPKNLRPPYRPVPVSDLPEGFRVIEGLN